MKSAAATKVPRSTKPLDVGAPKAPPPPPPTASVVPDGAVKDGVQATDAAKPMVSIAPAAGDPSVRLPSMSIGEQNDLWQQQAAIEGTAMLTWLFANPKVRDEMASLGERWNRASQSGPNLVVGSVISGTVPGGNALVRAWAHHAQAKADALGEKYWPMVRQQLVEVRAEIARLGGDPAKLDDHSLIYFTDQFNIELPPMRDALAKLGVNLDKLSPEQAVTLTRAATWGFNDRNEKVAHFSEAAVAPFRTP